MKQLPKFIWPLILLFSLTACTQTQLSNNRPPQAVDGVLDLRQWDFEQNGVVNLNGEWEFYWAQLLASDDFAGSSAPQMAGLINVPDSWRGYGVNGQTLTGHGYATYRLTVLIDPDTLPEESLAIKTPIFLNTAHKLDVDGKLLGSAGQVGPTAETMTPPYGPYVTAFVPGGGQVEILIQLPNFYHYEGGVTVESIVLGPQSQVRLINQRKLGRGLFLIGSIFIMGLYHLGLFSLRRREKALLYFGLFCLLVGGGTLILNQPSIFAHYISQGWAIFIRTRMLMIILAIFSMALFVHALFPQEYSRWVLSVIFGLGALLIGAFLLASTTVVTALILFLVPCILFINIYNFSVALMAVIHKRDGAIIFLLGYLFWLITIINDVLFLNGIIQTQQLMATGLFIFIFAQGHWVPWMGNQTAEVFKAISPANKAFWDTISRLAGCFGNLCGLSH